MEKRIYNIKLFLKYKNKTNLNRPITETVKREVYDEYFYIQVYI